MAVTWNPSDKNPYVLLSGGNLIARMATGGALEKGTVRATGIVPALANAYWEIEITTMTPPYSTVYVGAATSAAALDYAIGNNRYSWAYRPGGAKGHWGTWVAFGDTFVEGDIISVAVCRSSNELWWAKNGIWQDGGNPSTGANPAYTGLLDDVYPAVMVFFNPTGAAKVTANFGASAFTYTPPNGYGSLDNPEYPAIVFAPFAADFVLAATPSLAGGNYVVEPAAFVANVSLFATHGELVSLIVSPINLDASFALSADVFFQPTVFIHGHIYQNFNPIPGALYTLTLNYMHGAGDIPEFKIDDITNDRLIIPWSELPLSMGSYTSQSINFLVPATCAEARISLGARDKANTVYFSKAMCVQSETSYHNTLGIHELKSLPNIPLDVPLTIHDTAV